MFDDISFDTDDDKLKWGGILGGIGVATITTGVILCCFCRNCLRNKKKEIAMKREYIQNIKQTKLCVDDEERILNIGNTSL